MSEDKVTPLLFNPDYINAKSPIIEDMIAKIEALELESITPEQRAIFETQTKDMKNPDGSNVELPEGEMLKTYKTNVVTELEFFRDNIAALQTGDLKDDKNAELRIANGLGFIHSLSKIELQAAVGRDNIMADFALLNPLGNEAIELLKSGDDTALPAVEERSEHLKVLISRVTHEGGEAPENVGALKEAAAKLVEARNEDAIKEVEARTATDEDHMKNMMAQLMDSGDTTMMILAAVIMMFTGALDGQQEQTPVAPENTQFASIDLTGAADGLKGARLESPIGEPIGLQGEVLANLEVTEATQGEVVGQSVPDASGNTSEIKL